MRIVLPTVGVLLRWICLGTTALVLAGCANRPAVPGAGEGIVTESEESLARQRAQIRFQLALGYFERDQTAVALDEVKQALAIDPSLAAAYALRGVIYMRTDDPDLAEDSLRRALALNPRDADTLHNYGWLLCQQGRFGDAVAQFSQALATPGYAGHAKTLMTQGVCQIKAGLNAEAERSLTQAFELDPVNPITSYNLALLLSQREEWSRAQSYIERINHGPSPSAETLWLGIKIEHKLNNREAITQLGSQLQQRFPQSREAMMYERGNFND